MRVTEGVGADARYLHTFSLGGAALTKDNLNIARYSHWWDVIRAAFRAEQFRAVPRRAEGRNLDEVFPVDG